jgi:nitrite reductase/ring-hydroxylating ferredoxin subunit
MPDERHDRDAAEMLDRYLESLLGDSRPSPDDVGELNGPRAERIAAELVGAGRLASGEQPDRAFVEQLRLRMRRADEGVAAVRAASPTQPPGGRARWRVSRRDLVRAGLGMAAGLAVGSVGRVLLPERTTDRTQTGGAIPLVTGEGVWTEVARTADLPPGTAIRFSTAAFDGFVVNDGGTVRALAATCTHMGCTLRFRPDRQDLRCPCHGASFDLAGRLANGRDAWSGGGGYAGDERAYPIQLPDLARPEVRVTDGVVQVWTARL